MCLADGGGNNAVGALYMGESRIIPSSSSLASREVPLEEDEAEAETEAEGVLDGHPYAACGSSMGDVHGACLCIDDVVGVFEGENAFWGGPTAW